MKHGSKTLVVLALAALMTLSAPAAFAGGNGWKVGSKVMVNWKGTWYKATVTAVKDGKWKIHYDGWANTWDEWVGKARIKGK